MAEAKEQYGCSLTTLTIGANASIYDKEVGMARDEKGKEKSHGNNSDEEDSWGVLKTFISPRRPDGTRIPD